MGWTQQRGNRHRALYRGLDGKPKSAGTFQYAYQALAAANAAELMAKRPELGQMDPATVTVRQYADRWLATRTGIESTTRASYRNPIVNGFGLAFGDVPLVERTLEDGTKVGLTKETVREWVAAMEADPEVGASTRNYAVKVLRMMYKTAIEDDDLLAKNPTRGIKRQHPDLKPRRTWLSAEQTEDILTAAEDLNWLNSPHGGRRVALPGDGMFRLAILLGTDAGLRWEEISALSLSCVQILGERIVLDIRQTTTRKGRIKPTTKNHEAREVPVTTDRLRKAILHRMRLSRLEYGRELGQEALLIYRADGTPARYETWKRVYLDGAYAHAGVIATGWHDLRHTYGSKLAEKGVSTKIIATLMGHQEEDITKIYLHPSTTEHLATVVGSALSG